MIIFVTNSLSNSDVGGRALLSRLVEAALIDAAAQGCETYVLSQDPTRGASLLGRLLGFVDGATRPNISRLIDSIRKSQVDKVFINGSNLGRVASSIRKAFPELEIITFFHNCETQFFAGVFRSARTLRSLGVLVGNYVAERLAVANSDKRVCLTNRDALKLRRIFGRGGTHILPMAMQDRLPPKLEGDSPRTAEKYALFVGGAFYANIQGMEWFVDNVAAMSPIKTYVVGKGFESRKSSLERNGNVQVVGSVESLASWYLGSHFVVAPIFDGSGMKTKVAEALMFGRRVVGTPEAFVGYEDVFEQVGVACATPDEFLTAMETETARPFSGVDPVLRSAFESRYSFSAARDHLARILSD